MKELWERWRFVIFRFLVLLWISHIADIAMAMSPDIGDDLYRVETILFGSAGCFWIWLEISAYQCRCRIDKLEDLIECRIDKLEDLIEELLQKE